MASPPGPACEPDEASAAHPPLVSDAPRPGDAPCPLHDGRFCDCPTLGLERRSSTTHVGQEAAARHAGGAPESGRDTPTDRPGDRERPDVERAHGMQPRRHTLAPSPTFSGVLGASATTDHGQTSPSRRSLPAMQTQGNQDRRGQSQGTPGGLGDTPRERHTTPHAPPAPDEHRESTRRTSLGGSASHSGQSSEDIRARPQGCEQAGPAECMLPRWQPDAGVTYCPICHAQFSFLVRKHHCRKCGRVVCNSCSPHRIIIPHPYIVRPPGSEPSMPPGLLLSGLEARCLEASGPSGGERVRLCNPCVPDPNTAPPQSPAPSVAASPRLSHHRSRSNHGSSYGGAHSTSAYAAPFSAGRGGDAYQHYSPRWRSVMVGPRAHGGPATTSSHPVRISTTYHPPLEHYLAGASSSTPASSRRNRHGSLGEAVASSRHRTLPPSPQIAEEDECPICHRELPSRELPDFEALRESHVSLCIQAHSTYGGSPRGGGGQPAPHAAPRRTGMYTYAATEKDCIDDAECTICLEEFTFGVAMARLECLCRFHRACISAWFVSHPGRCPVHQHDGFGF